MEIKELDSGLELLEGETIKKAYREDDKLFLILESGIVSQINLGADQDES